MTKAISVVVILAIGAIWGCTGTSSSPKSVDALVIEPGRGIAGVCEIGMKQANVKTAIHEWGRGQTTRAELAPALAAIFFVEKSTTIEFIRFFVQPYKQSEFEIVTPFAGSIKGGPCFSGNRVTPKEVEGYFGKLITVRPPISFNNGQLTNSYCVVDGTGHEELWYRDRGVAFYVQSNIVISIGIFSPSSLGSRE